MIKLENHHAGKTTYIVGKFVINGCQMFEIADLDYVCSKFEVSDYHKESAKESYYKNCEVEDWESLANYPDLAVRIAVAEQCHMLNILVNDPDPKVRVVVATKGYGLNILVDDTEWRVRLAVALQGYGLNALVNDTEWRVRLAVSLQGYWLNALVNDTAWQVRVAVAAKLEDLQP